MKKHTHQDYSFELSSNNYDTLITNNTFSFAEEKQYLFFFTSDNKHSIASRKSINCRDEEIKLETKLKVNHGSKFDEGTLADIGEGFYVLVL